MFQRAEVIKVAVPFGCVKPSTQARDNKNGIEARFKTGGKAGATWIWQVGQRLSWARGGRHASLYPRMSSHEKV